MTDPLANSYYAATAHPWRSASQICDALSFDVAVVGGGFTGLAGIGLFGAVIALGMFFYLTRPHVAKAFDRR